MRKEAFALWQMLIGVAVVSGLAAVLWPVSSRCGGENPHRSACQSNLKLIGLAFKQYTQDYNEKFPLVGSERTGWTDAIESYIQNISVSQSFQCPAETSGRSTSQTDYFYNARLDGKPEEKFEFIANTILCGDGIGESPRNANLSQFPPNWAMDANSPAWRHLEGANYLFADGHVKWLRPPKITNQKANSSVHTFSID